MCQALRRLIVLFRFSNLCFTRIHINDETEPNQHASRRSVKDSRKRPISDTGKNDRKGDATAIVTGKQIGRAHV